MEEIRFVDHKNYLRKLFKKRIKNFFLTFFPNSFVVRLMEKNYTDMGLEISNACNADCSFCAYRYQKRSKYIMDFKMFKKAIDFYSKDGGGTVSFTPVVGDPLVDKFLIEKIKYARSKKNIHSVFMYTNAIFLDRYNLKELVQSGITRIAISTYFGTRELYKKYYGVDQYQRVIKNIINIAKVNIKYNKPIHFTMHLRLEQPEEKWRKNKEYLKIGKLVGFENMSFKTAYENWSGYITEKDLPKGSTLGEIVPNEKKYKEPCWELYRKLYIMSDGSVGVCASRDIEGEINIGNINSDSLTDIWRGNKIKEFRTKWKQGILPNVCVKCDRYKPISDYIKDNKYSILKTQVIDRVLKFKSKFL